MLQKSLSCCFRRTARSLVTLHASEMSTPDRSTINSKNRKELKTSLCIELISKMSSQGYFPMSQFVKECLTHPQHGYYTTKRHVIGNEKADFITAAEIPFFADVISAWIMDTWQKMGTPRVLHLIELGPGKGTLMKNMLKQIKYSNPHLLHFLQIHLVEVGAVRMEEQKNALSEFQTAGKKIKWWMDLESIPFSLEPTIFIANEYFDALPVAQFRYTERGWVETCLEVDEDPVNEAHFRMVHAPSGSFSAYLIPSDIRSNAKLGDCIEINAVGMQTMEILMKKMVDSQKAACLVVDYGKDEHMHSTLRGIRGHKFVDPLLSPGEVDLSSWVSFKQLRWTLERLETARRHLKWFPVVTQREFLQWGGIDVRLAHVIKDEETKKAMKILQNYRRLMDPDEMGQSYKRRHYGTERITESKFRNVTENTLADTPSGYIHDPANYPKRMVTYDKITTEGQAGLELIEREYDLMQREELAYSGYTTIPIQEWKEIVFKNTSTREELEFACTNLQNTLNELVGMIGCKVVKKSSRPILPLSIEKYEGEENEKPLEDVVVISEDDCNHLRYIIALALRRLGDYEKAESLCLNVLSLDHLNCDALESLIEIYTGTEQPKKLRELFDKIHCWGNEEEAAAMKLRETEIMEEGTSSKHNGKSSSVLDMAMILLSDMIIEAGSLHYIESGEGSTTRFFSEAVSSLIAAMGSQYTSLFFESLFRSMDEQHFAARLETSLIKSSEHVLGVVISFLKMLLARNYYELVEDPVRFEFHILSKLHSALRYAERKHESYKICERLIKLYREKSGKYELPSGKRISENSQGPLEDLEPTYKLALFQFVEDRGVDSLIVGKRLCIQAIEEFPEEASPWKTLALILHKEDHINGLSNAVVAAKRAFSLEPKNLSIVLLLANLYKAQKRYQLYEAMMDRYRLLNYLIENEASDKDMKATLEEIRDIDELHPHEKEPDDFEVQFAEMGEYMGRMEMANTYSMAVDKEPRVFNQQPVSAPILEPSICEDIPIRPKNIRNVS